MSTGLTNWSGNQTYGAAAVLRPGTVAELQEIVAPEPRIRALGTRHSLSAVADTPRGHWCRCPSSRGCDPAGKFWNPFLDNVFAAVS